MFTNQVTNSQVCKEMGLNQTLVSEGELVYRQRLHLYLTEAESRRVHQTILRSSANPVTGWNPWYEVYGGGLTPHRVSGIAIGQRKSVSVRPRAR